MARKQLRECGTCHEEKVARSFYSDSHTDCIACVKLKRLADEKQAISPDLDEKARLHRLAKAAKAEEKQLAKSAAKDKRKYAREQVKKRSEASLVDRELASRILSRRRLLHFVTRFHNKYSPGWVHEDICRRLERFSQAVADGKSPRLLLLMPPRHGKSEIASRKFPAWHLGKYPDHEIIATSHSSSLALGFSRHIRDLLRDPRYHATFDDARLDPDSQSVEQWRTTSGGGYTAAGVGTGITGMGAHILIVDDPVKDIEAADSVTIRDATWEWYLSTAYSRLAPGGGVLGIQTWWNDDDWAGRIQLSMATGDGEVFEVVKYPAINEGYDEYLDLDTDMIVEARRPDEVPKRAKLLRPKDTALHPARYTVEYLNQVKKNYRALGQQRFWSALYQQNPAPEEGAFFTREMFMYFAHDPQRRGNNIYQAWDFAITEKKQNDWNVCSTMLQDCEDDLYELDLMRFRTDNSFVIVDAILDQYEAYKPDLLGFEDGQIWKSIYHLFLRRSQERRLYPSFEVLQPLTDKLVRAGPLRGRMQNHKVRYRERALYREEADRELLRFPAGKHDDIVDARAWCVRLALLRQPPARPKAPTTKSWRDRLNASGAGASHMAA